MCENSSHKGIFCVDFAEVLKGLVKDTFLLPPLKGVFVANIKICLRQLLTSFLNCPNSTQKMEQLILFCAMKAKSPFQHKNLTN